MKQKIEKVIRNKKVAIALMECAVAIGCIVIFCLFMIPKDRIPDTTHSYSKVEKVTKYKVVDNYITRVMPLTDYETFKQIAESTLNNGAEGKNYTVKVYFDAEKTKEVTSGYIASGMIAEAENKAVNPTEVAGKTELEENEEENNKTVSYTISILGDMTKDGDINVTELTKITKCVIGLSNWSFTEEEKLASDLNGDGQIDIRDIESCINYIVFGELDIQEEKYTVTFKDYDGSIISTKTNYHYGDKIEIPENPTREPDETYNYEFAGWNPEITGTETVTGNAEYIATYRMVANRAQYTVEHYKQEADGTYTLAETEDLEGTIGEKVTAIAKNYVGYSEDTENENRIAEGIVEKEKSLVLKLYYKINQYTVTFKDEDGTIISEKTDYHYGDTVLVPENPTKAEDETYTYEFAGWKNEETEAIGVTTVTEDAEYIATYTSKYKEYTITFKNEDGTVISERRDYHYGDTVTVPENPTKAEDETYTYEFAGWKNEETEEIGVTTVTEDAEYIATYTSKYKEYTIAFKNEDGTVISEKTDYHYGDTVVVPENPTKEADETYIYEFAGWKNEETEAIGVTTVTEDAEYIATYTSKYKEYTITFKNEDGTVISEKTDYHYGDTVVVPENPTKSEDETCTYEFAGWKKEGTEEIGVTTVTEDTEYIATYTSKYKEYTITFKNEDGTVISEKTDYHYGDTVVVPENPTKEDDETYTYEFAGWKNEETEEIGVKTVTGDAEYIATYESTYREYTIIFEDYDGTVISKKTDYHYGQTVSVPDSPKRTEDETYTYEFAGWDKEITEVTKNTTYIATYINKYKEYTITFKQDTGDVINSTTYHYGDSVQIPENPVKESTVEYAYTFVGWTPEVEETVTQSAEYTATYEEQAIEYNFIFYNDDGVTEVARIENYRWGDNIKLPTAPTKEPTEEINYVFSEWKNLGVEEVSKTQKNIRFMAQYTEEYFVARLMETETLEGVSYLTLEEAVENAGDDVRTIKLLQDTQESVMIEDNQNITLNLNGKTITGAKAYAIRNYGILTVTDETETKEGKIKESATSSLGYGIHNRDGKVTIKSGMIVTETTQESGTTYGIYNQSEETLVIEGGSIIAEAKGESATSCGIYNLAGKEIVISGGTVLGNAIAGNSTSYGIYNATEGIINVTNGSVEGRASLASATSYGIYNAVSENVTINGGTVVAQSDKSIAYGVYNKKGKISVLGGTIEVTAAQGYGVYNEIGTVEVQAGKIKMVGTTSYGIYNVGSLEVSGGEIELLASSSYGIYNNGQMSVTGGTINSKNANTGYGIYNNSSLNTSIGNTTISGTNYGTYNNKGILTVTNSNITATHGIYTYGSNTNTIVESANIMSTTYGIYNNDYGNTILKNVNIVSEQYGVYNNNTGNVEIGVKDQNISVENPNIYGKTYAIYNDLASSGAIKYYDGVLTGEMAIYGGVNEIEDNSQIVIQITEEGFEVATLQSIEQGNVAKIGETEYKNLSDAVEAVEENLSETTVIELIADFEISKAVEIPTNKNVTIDLAGHGVTTYAKGGMTNKGTLKITDSTEQKQGKIIGAIGIGISNKGTLIFEEGTIESNRYGITTSVNTVIKECSINAIIGISGGGNITLENGTVTGTQTGIICNTNSVVNIKGGKIQGNTAVDVSGATINIEDGQIEGEGYGIKSNSSIVNVKNGNIIGKSGYGIGQIFGTTQITGGNIKGTYGVVNKSGTCIIGTKDGKIKQETPIIIGEKCGIEQGVEWRKLGIFQYYDGKIAGQTKAIDGSVNEVEEEKQIQINTETIDEQEYQVASLVDEEVHESGIAQIGDNVYITVSSLKQAIDEIETNTEQPVKVTILNDFEMTQTISIKAEQNIKIGLNGKTITSIAAINNSGNLEITDETEESQGKIVNTNSDAIVNGGKLTIIKGTIEGARYGIYGLNDTNAILGAKDGEVDATSPVIIGKEQGTYNVAKMYDGIIKGKNNYSSPTQTEKGYKIYNYREDGYYITAIELELPIARTGGQDYNSLQEAIDACGNGDTVEILRNVDNIKNTVTVGEDKNIVLDLKGYTINSSSEKTLINNGTLSIATSTGTIENTNSSGITIENNGEINLSNGSVSSNYGKAVQNNGILKVAGGAIGGRTYGIYNNENATLEISSGYISSQQYCIYNNSTNTINITDGYIRLNAEYYNSKYGIYNNVEADINMTGGEICYIDSWNSEYVYGIYNNANGNILISAQDERIYISGAAYGYGIYNNAEGTVTLQKGTISVNSQYLGYGIRNTYKGKVEITGGSINVTSNDGYAYGIENGSLGNAELINGNISVKTNTGTAYGIRNISLNPLKIKNGTIKATGAQSYGIYNNTSDLVIGENDESVSSDSPVIESDFVGIYINELGTKFGFYDGKVIAKQAINVDANVPEGYRLLKYFDKEKQKEVAEISQSDNYVLTYYLNGEKYESIILKSGSEVLEKIIEEEGYEFNGWQNLPETMPEEDINVYGNLTPKTYTITYYVDGEQYGEVDTFEYKSNVSPRELPTKEERAFSGWEGIPTTMPARDIEVNGYFTYIATFYGEDEETVLGTDEFTIKDEKLTEPEIPYKEGYIGMWSAYEVKAEDISAKVIYFTEDELENAIAINTTKGRAYDTLQEAINNVATDGTENTIKLLKDTTESTTTTSGQNIILDLNGKTISVTEPVTGSTVAYGITNNAMLTIKDTSEEDTGRITATSTSSLSATGIYNTGTGSVIVKGGSIEVLCESSSGYYGDAIGIRSNGTGNVIIEGGNIEVSSQSHNAYGIKNLSTGNIIVTGGTITVTNKSNDTGGIYNNNGDVYITGGTITVTSPYNNSNAIGISNHGGNVIVEGGNIKVTGTSWRAEGIHNNGGKVTLIEGKIEATSTYKNAYGIGNYSNGISTVTGGTIIATNTNYDAFGIYNDGGVVNVTGGSIISTSINKSAHGIFNNSDVTVTGGNITATSDKEAFGIYNYGTGTVTLKGGSIEVSGKSYYTSGIYNYSTGNVIVEGGTITVTDESTYSASGIYNYGNGTVTVEGGSITATSESGFPEGISNNSSGTVTITGGNITVTKESHNTNVSSSISGIRNDSGEVDISGGTITVIDTNNDSVDGMYNNNDGTVNISGGNIIVSTTYSSSGITNYGNVTMTGGSITAISETSTANGITNRGNVTIGTKDGNVNLEEPRILGKTCGIYNDKYWNTIFNYYDGQILAKESVIDGNITEIEEGRELKEETEEIGGEEYKKITLIEERQYEGSIALINNEGDYRTVSSLIEAINDMNTEDEVEVKLLQDIQLSGNRLGIRNNQNLILDLNGKEIKISNGKITNNGKLIVKDTSEEKNGTIRSEGVYAIYNNSELTIEEGNIIVTNTNDSAYGIYNTVGIANILGGTIEARSISGPAYGVYNYNSSGTVTVTGGTITAKSESSSAYGIYNYGTVTVIGGIIEGTGESSYTYGISNSSSGTVTLGTKDGRINSEEPKVLGKEYGISNYGIFNYYDGQILGKESVIDGNITEIEEESELKEETEEIQGGEYKKITLIEETQYEESIALINNEGDYRTVSSLIAAIKEIDNEEETEVKLLQNLQIPLGLEIENNQNIVLDLNAKEIGMKYGRITNNGNLVIKDTSEEKNGTIRTESVHAIDNNSELTIQEGNIVQTTTERDTYVIYNNSGIVTMSGGSITVTSEAYHSFAQGISSSGNVIVTGGNITVISTNYSAYGINNYSNGTVTVLGGNIIATGNNSASGIRNYSGTVTLGTKDGVVDTEKPNIEGSEYGISKSSDAILNFYDGKVSGGTSAINGDVSEVEEGYEIKTITDSISNKEANYLGIEKSAEIETEHNYSNNVDITYTKTLKGASSLNLSFDGNCRLEDSYDYIEIYDKNNQMVYSSKGKGATALANTTMSVEGDTVSIKFHTDGSVTYWGFKCYIMGVYESYNVTTNIYSNRTIHVEDILGNLTDGKIEYGETYKFRLLDETDQIVTDEKVYVKMDDSELQEIQPNENGVYAIANIVNDTEIAIIDIGQIATDENGITWRYALDEEGRAVNVVYLDGKLEDKIIIPQSLDGHEVVSIGNSTVQTNIFGKDVSINAIQIPSTTTTIYDNAFNNCSYLKDIYIDNSEEDMTLGNNWNGKAYVHYKNDKHNVDIKIFDGRTIVEESDSAEIVDNKIDCNGIFKFKVFNANGDIITNEEIMIISQGEYIDSSNISTIISPNEEGIYSIENINRNLTIIIGRLDGQTYQATDGNGITWNYTLQNMEATNVYYAIGDLGETVTIPDALDGFPVVSLHNDSVSGNIFAKSNWSKNTNIKNIVIPSSITNIGAYAFCDCENLADINIPEGVISIGNYAFSRCSNLASIDISSSVTSIGWSAFSYCEYNGWSGDGKNGYFRRNNLTSIVVNDNNKNYCSEDNILYNKEKTELILCAAKKEGEVIIPEGVTNINYGAFYDCKDLTNIDIPEGVTSIGEYAFFNCSSLTSIEIPNSLTSIESNVFMGCMNLTSIAIPSGITNIGAYAFRDCENLADINIPEGVISIGNDAFSRCSNLTSINIPDSVTSIGYGAFYYCTSLTNVNIPEGVTIIQQQTFDSCRSLASINIPDSVTSIGYGAFYYCTSLTNVNIPEGVTNIGDRAFYGCSSLTSIVVNDNNKNYCSEDNILYNKEKTELILCAAKKEGEVIIPEGVTNINYGAFYDCKDLTNIDIPEGVTSIGEYAFFNCSSLTSISIPKGITSISNYVFYECSSLTSIEIPDSVTSIGGYVFYSCDKLTDIYINNLESNITFVSSWKDNTNAYVHYSDCKQSITIELETGLQLEEISNRLQNSKITCGETYQFRVVNANGEVIKNRKVEVTSQGKFTNSKEITEEIIPDEEGIYTIENVNRDKTIKIGIINGEKVQTEDKNGITWNYTYQDGQAANVYYESGELREIVTIPDALDGYPVVSIYNSSGNGRNIFAKTNYENNTIVKTVIIPDSATIIGDYAFWNCSSLSSIEIPNSVTSIGTYAFYNCSLTNIVIPNSVTSIGGSAFYNCDSLTTIELPNSITNIGYSAFYDCNKLTDIYVDNLKSNVTFDYILSSGSSAHIHYKDCKHSITSSIYSKTKIEIQEVSNNLENGKIACQETYQFKLLDETGETITNEKVIIKSEGRFIYSKDTEEEILPNDEGIYKIENVNRNKIIVISRYDATTEEGITWNYQYQDGKAINVYYKGGTLPEVLNIPESLDGYPVVSLYNDSVEGSIFTNAEDESYISDRRVVMDYYGYESQVNVKVINIPSTVTTIGNNAFERCSNLETINIPESVTSIGDYAFYGCGLKNISMGDNVTNIGKYAFSNCGSLTSAEISNSITEIEEGTFRYCSNLTSVNIPEGVTSIGYKAFYQCTSLSNIEIPDSVTSVGNDAFYNTPWYNNQPDGLVYLGKVAYAYKGTMPENTTIQIKEGMTTIQSYLFGYEKNLVEVEIPDSVTSIGNDAFNMCTNLRNVTMSKNIKYIGSAAFGNCTSLESIVIWKNVDEVGYRTFDGWKDSQTVNIEANETPQGWDEN